MLIRTAAAALALASSLSVFACAGTRGGATGQNAELIERPEMEGEAVATLSVYEAIQQLRPSWLRPRGSARAMTQSGLFPGVLLHNEARNDIELLRSILLRDVLTLRYISSRDATTLYGTEYAAGMIEVTMRAGNR
jgi:hypothetical protein